jgi:hypothetical protein
VAAGLLHEQILNLHSRRNSFILGSHKKYCLSVMMDKTTVIDSYRSFPLIIERDVVKCGIYVVIAIKWYGLICEGFVV